MMSTKHRTQTMTKGKPASANSVDRRQAALRRRWQRLCADAVQLAIDMGAKDLSIYVESESGLLVLSGDSHPRGNDFVGDTNTVVVDLGWPTGVKRDCGAW